jgi:hypothetical protein
MRRTLLFVPVAMMTVAAAAQQPAPLRLPATEPAKAVYPLDGAFLQWPLPAGSQAYGDIDGRHLHTYVVEQAAISRRYRDQGHPQFWGRITGTSGDAESADWLAAHFRRISLSEIRIQPIDLPPQWMPQSWTVMATSGATTLQLDRSAQPAYGTPGTTGDGLDVDAVWVGTYAEPEQAPPPGDLGRFFRFVPGVDAGDFNMYFHTDEETPETVPWTGLEASTRAYAKIIDGVNTLDLKDLQRPPEPEPGPRP